MNSAWSDKRAPLKAAFPQMELFFSATQFLRFSSKIPQRFWSPPLYDNQIQLAVIAVEDVWKRQENW
jgi:hypothetical protein